MKALILAFTETLREISEFAPSRSSTVCRQLDWGEGKEIVSEPLSLWIFRF